MMSRNIRLSSELSGAIATPTSQKSVSGSFFNQFVNRYIYIYKQTNKQTLITLESIWDFSIYSCNPKRGMASPLKMAYSANDATHSCGKRGLIEF